MGSAPQPDQAETRKTLEEKRAERIAAVADPGLRRDLDALVKARDAKLSVMREVQAQRYEKDVADIRKQKMKSVNGPQLTPPGMKPRPYIGPDGYVRATMDAKVEVARQYQNALKSEAKPYNDQIDKRLDAEHVNQSGRGPAIPTSPERGPNRYAALIDKQNYVGRANDQEAERQRTQEQEREQQRRRSMNR